jgi:uncharacterized protein YbcV (DUF1398 family)
MQYSFQSLLCAGITVNGTAENVKVFCCPEDTQINRHFCTALWAATVYVFVVDLHGDTDGVIQIFFDVKHMESS